MGAVREALTDWSTCPGCGLRLPSVNWESDGRLQNSPECWQLYTELVGATMSQAGRAAAVQQLSIDAYGAQHSGPGVAPITTVFSLLGLFLAVERDVPGYEVREAHQRLAALDARWPELARPERTGEVTVFDVALADDAEDHVRRAHEWARSVWADWAPWRPTIMELTERHLPDLARR
jgi:hypothetical protein